jgi:hypothetical protein
MAPLLANTARAQAVAFTEFYSESGNQAVVRQDAKFETWEQLNDPNVTFAVASGTQDETQVKKLFPNCSRGKVVGGHPGPDRDVRGLLHTALLSLGPA